jgi:hypothetical protein
MGGALDPNRASLAYVAFRLFAGDLVAEGYNALRLHS